MTGGEELSKVLNASSDHAEYIFFDAYHVYDENYAMCTIPHLVNEVQAP